MARLEAVLASVEDGEVLRDAITRQVSELGGTFIWFDNRNASIALTTGARAMAVEVLLELRYGSELGVLVRSREVMGNGAPLSTAVLERLLAGLLTALPAAVVRFRSDRDGPIRQRTRAGALGRDHEYLAAGCD